MVIEPIIWRRSIREYSDEPVLDNAIEDLVRAARFAPKAMGNEAMEVLIIKKQQIKDDLREILEQDFIAKAPILLVLTSDTRKTAFSDYDLAAASGFAMIQAAALGLGTVWKHIGDDKKEAVRKVLELPEEYNFINIIPVGFPLNDLPDHSDKELNTMKVHRDKW
jgi:nitroreductase